MVKMKDLSKTETNLLNRFKVLIKDAGFFDRKRVKLF